MKKTIFILFVLIFSFIGKNSVIAQSYSACDCAELLSVMTAPVDGLPGWYNVAISYNNPTNHQTSMHIYCADDSCHSCVPACQVLQKNCSGSFIVTIKCSNPSKIKVALYANKDCKGDPCKILVLPVSLEAFSVQRQQGNINLTWITASEINNTGFGIEKSTDSKTWNQIDFVASKGLSGNSNLKLNYSYTDNTGTTGNLNYYRLRQVDLDGKVAYSPIRVIRAEGQTTNIIVYPVPSHGTVNVMFDNISTKYDVSLNSVDGKLLSQWSNAQNNLIINNIPRGMYFVRIFSRDSNVTTTRKIIIQ